MSIDSCLKEIADKAAIQDTEKTGIQTSINAIKGRLINRFGSQMKDCFIFGSYARGTILPRSMDGNSDIDCMVIFEKDALQNFKPQTYLDRLRRCAEVRYNTSEIKQSHPTIKLEMNHITFELIPAIEIGFGNYNIPSKISNYDSWISTHPHQYDENLNDLNKKHHWLIKPLVRILKYWNVLNGKLFTSFELEEQLVDIITKSFLPLVPKEELLKSYFYRCIENLQSFCMPEGKKQKVSVTKELVQEAKKFESDKELQLAESKIRNIFKDSKKYGGAIYAKTYI